MALSTTTYSFKDVSFAFTHPLVGSFIANGQVGLGQLTIAMTLERSAIDMSADGSAMISYMTGDNGSIAVECQQTSALYGFLLNWFNTIKTLADGGDPTDWATAVINVVDLIGNHSHTLNGVCPTKIPDKQYARQGQMQQWHLLAAQVNNL